MKKYNKIMSAARNLNSTVKDSIVNIATGSLVLKNTLSNKPSVERAEYNQHCAEWLTQYNIHEMQTKAERYCLNKHILATAFLCESFYSPESGLRVVSYDYTDFDDGSAPTVDVSVTWWIDGLVKHLSSMGYTGRVVIALYVRGSTVLTINHDGSFDRERLFEAPLKLDFPACEDWDQPDDDDRYPVDYPYETDIAEDYYQKRLYDAVYLDGWDVPVEILNKFIDRTGIIFMAVRDAYSDGSMNVDEFHAALKAAEDKADEVLWAFNLLEENYGHTYQAYDPMNNYEDENDMPDEDENSNAESESNLDENNPYRPEAYYEEESWAEFYEEYNTENESDNSDKDEDDDLYM